MESEGQIGSSWYSKKIAKILAKYKSSNRQKSRKIINKILKNQAQVAFETQKWMCAVTGKRKSGLIPMDTGDIDTQVAVVKYTEGDDYANSIPFLCAKHCPKCFTFVVSFNSYNNPVKLSFYKEKE